MHWLLTTDIIVHFVLKIIDSLPLICFFKFKFTSTSNITTARNGCILQLFVLCVYEGGIRAALVSEGVAALMNWCSGEVGIYVRMSASLGE